MWKNKSLRELRRLVMSFGESCRNVVGISGRNFDGSSIETVVVDTKGEDGFSDVASRYGHDGCQNVLEFCGEDCIGDDLLVTLGKSGLGVVGFSNCGAYAGVAGSFGDL